MFHLHRTIVLGALHASLWFSLTSLMADLSPLLIGFDPHRDFWLLPTPENAEMGKVFTETLAKLGFAAFLNVAKPVASFFLLFSLIYRYGMSLVGPVRGELPPMARFALSLMVLALGVASFFQLTSAFLAYLNFRLGTWQKSFVLSTHEHEPLFFMAASLILSTVLALAAWCLWWDALRGTDTRRGAFGQSENLVLVVEILVLFVFLVSVPLIYCCGFMGFGFYAILSGALPVLPGNEEVLVIAQMESGVAVMATTAMFLMSVLMVTGLGLRLLGLGIASDLRAESARASEA